MTPKEIYEPTSDGSRSIDDAGNYTARVRTRLGELNAIVQPRRLREERRVRLDARRRRSGNADPVQAGAVSDPDPVGGCQEGAASTRHDRQVSVMVVERDLAPSRVPMYRTLSDMLGCDVLVIVDTEQDALRNWGPGTSTEGLKWCAGGSATVIREILRRRPTHVIVGGWDRVSRWAALATSGPAGAQRLMLLGSWKPSGRTARWCRPLSFARARTALALCDGVLAYSTRAANYGRSLGASRVAVFGNATSVPDLAPIERASGQQRERFRVVALGRLLPEKRFDLLVAAMTDLAGCELRIVGTGPERAPLERLARSLRVAERVSFAGLLERRQALQEVRRADLLCLPSDYEPWGLCLNEAMMLGTMVASSCHVGAVGDLVQHRITGFVVDRATVEAWRETIAAAAAITAPERAALIDRAAQEARGFTPERAGERIAAFIREPVA